MSTLGRVDLCPAVGASLCHNCTWKLVLNCVDMLIVLICSTLEKHWAQKLEPHTNIWLAGLAPCKQNNVQSLHFRAVASFNFEKERPGLDELRGPRLEPGPDRGPICAPWWPSPKKQRGKIISSSSSL